MQTELFPERLVTEAERRQVRHDVRDQRRILVETIRAHTKRRLAEIAPNDTGHGAIRREAAAVRRFVTDAATGLLAETAGAGLTIAAATTVRGRLPELIEKLSADAVAVPQASQ
jgi:hypothetical protein